MSDEDWKTPDDDDGITLGPEDALRREIEKSKSLKVERLKLKDEIETLRAKNAQLTENISALKEKAKNKQPTPTENSPSPSPGWSVFLLIFNLCALAILLFFIFQK